ncbi:DUF3797 domain-containing protein [Paenibacillus sp. B2(2019)]|nr:DUF3797 domain-containing protein [Paenibacillus sp. B2(2019)]
MNLNLSMILMKKYVACLECGNENLGNGEGTLQIEGDTFRRTCKCGWKVETDATEAEVDQ